MYRRNTGWMCAALAALLWTVGCNKCGQAPGLREVDSKAEVARGPSETAPSAAKPPARARRAPAKKDARPWFEVYRFAEHLERGHLSSGGFLIDLGTPSARKHTLGGWRTGWRGEYDDEGVTYSYLEAAQGFVFFHAAEDELGPVDITLKAKGIGTRKVQVLLNGTLLGTVQFDRGEFVHKSVQAKDGLRAGSNELRLRALGERRRAHDGKKAAIAVDYLRVTPESHIRGAAASTYDAVLYPDQTGGPDDLLLNGGESLTYYLPIPPNARLSGEVVARPLSGEGRLEVSILVDGQPKRTLGEYKVGSKSQSLKLSLDEYAGRSAGIVFQSFHGEVVLGDLLIESLVGRGPSAGGKRRARNVVLVLIDTLRADRLVAYNAKTRVQAPHLERLAGESVVFERALTPENWTKPAIASLLSGLYPDTHRTSSDAAKLPGSVEMISEYLRDSGFETAAFVANGYVSGKFGFEQGWDYWTNYVREGKRNRAEFVVDEAVSWLDEYPGDKPFFLYVHTIDPHVPYIPPKRYWTVYDNEPYDGPIQGSQTAKLLERVKTGKLKLKERDKIRLEALYDGEVTYHDDHLVRLYETLQRKGLLEDTLVIITSDHGEEFFEHGKVGHGHSLYQELLHVPLYVRLPGAERAEEPVRIAASVDLTAVVPTACELLGLPCPEGVEGRSLLPLMGGEIYKDWPQAGYSNFMRGGRAVQLGQYKLFYRGLNASVFDLSTDPLESQDREDELPVTHTMLRDQLGLHLGSVGGTRHVSRRRAAPKKQHKAEQVEIDAKTKAQLQELGYLLE